MKLISGHGPSDTRIMIVGDYPSEEEYNNGYSFSGKVGDTLRDRFRGTPTDLDDVYKTYYIKCWDKRLKTRDKKILKDTLDHLSVVVDSQQILLEEIRAIKPNVIIALGERALNFLCNEEKLDNFRGSILPPSPFLNLPDSVKIIPSFHPRRIWEDYKSRVIVNLDIAKALKLQYSQQKYIRNELLWIARTYNDLRTYWDRARRNEFIVFDIETYANVPTCIGFCSDGYEAVCVPLFEGKSALDKIEIWKLVQEILLGTMPKVNHNILYDSTQMEATRFIINNIYDDSLLLAHSVYPEFPKKLQFQTSIHTDQPYYKDEGSEYNPWMNQKDQLYYYNAKDALVTHQVYTSLRNDAKELGVWEFHREKIWPLFHVYKKINERGIRIDEEQRDILEQRYTRMYNHHVTALYEAFGQEFNINSSQQVARFVYDYLECPKITHQSPNGTETLSTDKESLEELYLNYNLDETRKRCLKEIIVVRKIDTILDYIMRTVHPDGRMRTAYRIHGTKSGRTSGTFATDSRLYLDKDDKFKLRYGNYGGSFQVIPKRTYEAEEFEGEIYGTDIPTMFIPSPGYVFIEGDGKAAEARVVCVESEDYETLELMDRIDIHKLTAQWTTDKPAEAITKYDRENFGKRARHAGNYDMTKWRLSTMIHRPVNLCDAILTKFHDKAVKIRMIFHAQTREVVNNTGILVTPHGRRRDFFGRHTNEFYKEAYSFRPQAIVSDHMKFSIQPILNEIPTAEFLIEKHDSLLAEVPVNLKERYFECFMRIGQRPISFRTGSLIRDFELSIPMELQWSDTNWGEMKEVKC